MGGLMNSDMQQAAPVMAATAAAMISANTGLKNTSKIVDSMMGLVNHKTNDGKDIITKSKEIHA
jgi:hypothetical protein